MSKTTITRRQASNIAKEHLIKGAAREGADSIQAMINLWATDGIKNDDPMTIADWQLVQHYFQHHLGRVQDFLTR